MSIMINTEKNKQELTINVLFKNRREGALEAAIRITGHQSWSGKYSGLTPRGLWKGIYLTLASHTTCLILSIHFFSTLQT